MKNTNTKFLIFTALTVLLFSGCNDTFLDEEPKDALFVDNLYASKSGFDQGINALYALIRRERTDRAGVSVEASFIWKAGTDTAWGNYTFNALRAFDIYGSNLNPANNSLENMFNTLYDIVNSSNLIISRAEVSGVDWEGANETENDYNKNLVIAHARLFRAWAYRHLTNSWGDVPLSLEEIDGSTFKTAWPREDVEIVRQQMEVDLLFAEEHLADNYNNPLVLSKVVAQHLLAELYLTMDDPAKAEIKAEAAIDNPNFKLVNSRFGVSSGNGGTPFTDIFKEGNALPENGNTETLWAFLNTLDVPGEEVITMRRTWVNRYYNITSDDNWAFSQYGGRGIGRLAHTLYVEDLYEDTDDRYSEYAFNKFYFKEEGGDLVLTEVPTFSDWKASDRYWPNTKKWDGFADLERVNSTGSHANMVYMRLAETYLLLAEAEMKLNKNDEAAIHINALRTRSNATPITANDVNVDLILDERARELISEEYRRYTLNRFGLLVSRTQQYNKFTQITDRDILFPLPQDFIDSNEAPIQQNFGWE
jgi:hypothetical protein